MVLFSHQFIYYSANDEINTHTSDSYIAYLFGCCVVYEQLWEIKRAIK